jgi:hypothetical protein
MGPGNDETKDQEQPIQEEATNPPGQSREYSDRVDEGITGVMDSDEEGG